jgi:hypothetical protein
MSVISWGKPLVEYAITPDKSADPTKWDKMPEIKEDSASLDVTEGELIEATEEGGAVVDARRKANKYKFVVDIFVKKNDTRPIPDTNGIIANNYSVRVTPEDPACEGFILRKTNVTVSERWSAAEGKMLRYTFDGIKPDNTAGIICEPYIAGVSS